VQSSLTSADYIPFDIQRITGNKYQHFEIYAVHVRALKSFCELAETKCKAILGHSKTM
jgi:CMP-2-keto-3-deoxyoctulosonic acid synthetase